jgi:hypothetical protein
VEDDKNWETFEYMLNRQSPSADTATLERSTGGWNWEKAAEVAYTVEGNRMVVTVPRAALGIDEDDFTVNFKWSDNMQSDGDIMDFYVNGDVAPGARFKYSFTAAKAFEDETETTEETNSAVDTSPVTDPETTCENTPETDPESAPETYPETTCENNPETNHAIDSDTVSEEQSNETLPSESKGCRSCIPAAGLLAVSVAASAVVMRKKKESRE